MATVDGHDRILDPYDAGATALQLAGELPHHGFIGRKLVGTETHDALPQADDMADVVFGSEIDPVDLRLTSALGGYRPIREAFNVDAACMTILLVDVVRE